MTSTDYRDDFIAQDTGTDESSPDTGTGQPLSSAEIEELLYGPDRSTAERLRLLRSLRSDLAERDAGEVAAGDPAALVEEIDARIAELRQEARDSGGIVADRDPLAHRETLAPDSDELDALEEADAASRDEEDDWLDEEDEPGGDYQDAVEEDFEEDEDEGDLDNDDDAPHG